MMPNIQGQGRGAALGFIAQRPVNCIWIWQRHRQRL